MCEYKVDILTNFVYLWIQCRMFPLNLPNSVTFLSKKSYYRPQTRFVKVMFFHVSVHGGKGAIPACIAGVSQHALQQVSGGWYPNMPCRFPGLHPGGNWGEFGQGDLQAHTQGGSWGGLAWECLQAHTKLGLQAHTQGVCSQGGAYSKGAACFGGACSKGGLSALGGLLPGGCGDPPGRLLLGAVRILLECIFV